MMSWHYMVEILHRRNTSAVTTISRINLKIYLLFVLLTINILINAVIARSGRAEVQKFRSPRQNSWVCNIDFKRGDCYYCPKCVHNVTWRYLYSRKEDTCSAFIYYRHCEVNANNFESKEECERTCLRVPRQEYFEL